MRPDGAVHRRTTGDPRCEGVRTGGGDRAGRGRGAPVGGGDGEAGGGGMSAVSVTESVTDKRRCAAPKGSRRLRGRRGAVTCSARCRMRLMRWRKARRGLPGARGQPGASRSGDDWWTPRWLLDAARAALGGRTGLDPASSPGAQRRVGAEVWYGPGSPWAVDGLAVDPWPLGGVFCNPPYGRQPGSRTKLDWTRRLAGHHAEGRGEAVAVLPGDLSAAWAGPVHDSATAVLFARGRIRFRREGIEARDPSLGTLIACWGADADALPERVSAWRRAA